MDITLTQGAIHDLLNGVHVEYPIMQILGIKKVTTNNQRFRLLLSDGVYSSSSFLLATQLNDLAVNGDLDTLAVVKLNKIVVNNVQGTNRPIAVILDLKVLAPGSEVGRLGNPQAYEQGASAPTAVRENIPQREPPSYRESFASRVSASATATASHSTNNNFMNQSASFGSMPNRSTASTSQFEGRAFPISTLTPFQNRWVICARVVNKTLIKNWSNNRGDRKLFSVTFLDFSGVIRATGFNAECDRFFELLEIDKVYYVSNAQLKTPNRQFNSVAHEYEITFSRDTVIELCNDSKDMPKIKFEFVPIKDLREASKEQIVDVLGVCKSFGDCTTIVSRKSNQELRKRELQLVDDSNTEISITLWGEQAEKFDGSSYPVIAAKGVKVSDFGGVSLSLLNSSSIYINPDIKEAYSVRSWYDNEASRSEIQSLSVKSGGFSGTTPWKCLAQVEIENLGMGDKPDYFTCKATVIMIKKDNCLYKACVTCNKKVQENNGCYRCEKCNNEDKDFKYRYLLNINIADYSGSLWVTCFQDQAEMILGHSAEDLGRLIESGEDEKVQAFITEATFNSFIFTLVIKMESFNDENRIKPRVVSVTRVNDVEYAKKLIADIQN